MEPSPAAHLGSVRKSSFHRDVDSQTRLTSVPPSPLHLPRLEELDNAPQPQREEQWSTVSKNALPKTVAKTAAKAVVKDPSSAVDAHATGHAFGALTKFMEADGDGNGDGDESEDELGEASAGAFNVSDFKVSRPFYHTFEDTGKGVWCCVVTSPSGFDSAPIPITATVKRASKLKPNSPPPALVPEEEAEVVLDFKRRQKEERKKAAAEGGKKKKKKKKGGAVAAAEDAPAPPDASEVTVTQNPVPSEPEDKARLSKEILDDLFAASAYRPPVAENHPCAAYVEVPLQTFDLDRVHPFVHVDDRIADVARSGLELAREQPVAGQVPVVCQVVMRRESNPHGVTVDSMRRHPTGVGSPVVQEVAALPVTPMVATRVADTVPIAVTIGFRTATFTAPVTLVATVGPVVAAFRARRGRGCMGHHIAGCAPLAAGPVTIAVPPLSGAFGRCHPR